MHQTKGDTLNYRCEYSSDILQVRNVIRRWISVHADSSDKCRFDTCTASCGCRLLFISSLNAFSCCRTTILRFLRRSERSAWICRDLCIQAPHVQLHRNEIEWQNDQKRTNRSETDREKNKKDLYQDVEPMPLHMIKSDQWQRREVACCK